MFRSLLFITTNIGFMVLISTVLYFGVNYFAPEYLYYFQSNNFKVMFAVFLVMGFMGSFFSLFSSKWLAKKRMGIYIIKEPTNEDELWIIENVAEIAAKARIGMPEVGTFKGAPNAFATGWNRNNALLVISDGLYFGMTKDEVRGVIAHEVAHIAKGDMITMSLLQGLVNTFVLFFAWLASTFVVNILKRIPMLSFVAPIFSFLIFNLFTVVFGFFGSLITMWFSRHREYKADKMAAELIGAQSIYDALGRLDGVSTNDLNNGMKTMGFIDKSTFTSLLDTHPSLEKRRTRLENSFE